MPYDVAVMNRMRSLTLILLLAVAGLLALSASAQAAVPKPKITSLVAYLPVAEAPPGTTPLPVDNAVVCVKGRMDLARIWVDGKSLRRAQAPETEYDQLHCAGGYMSFFKHEGRTCFDIRAKAVVRPGTKHMKTAKKAGNYCLS